MLWLRAGGVKARNAPRSLVVSASASASASAAATNAPIITRPWRNASAKSPWVAVSPE